MSAMTIRARVVRVVRRVSSEPERLVELEVLARDAGVSADLVRRFAALGLVEPAGGTRHAPLFPHDAAAQFARAARLRRDLGLNSAGAVLACELLARIEELEERLERYRQ